MDLVQILLFVKAGIGGEDMWRAVDCSSLEPLVMAAGSVRMRRKKKGKFGICGVLSILWQIKCKLDQIFAGLVPKPNRRRKWIHVLGLTTSCEGWALGSDQKSDLGISSDPGQCSLPGFDLGPGQKNVYGLDFRAGFC